MNTARFANADDLGEAGSTPCPVTRCVISQAWSSSSQAYMKCSILPRLLSAEVDIGALEFAGGLIFLDRIESSNEWSAEKLKTWKACSAPEKLCSGTTGFSGGSGSASRVLETIVGRNIRIGAKNRDRHWMDQKPGIRHWICLRPGIGH